MIPVSLFFWLVAAWTAVRVVLFVDARLVRDRSRGFQSLVAMGAIAYGVPTLLEHRWWALPVVALGVRSVSVLIDLAWPVSRVRQTIAMRRRTLPYNVFPLRSS